MACDNPHCTSHNPALVAAYETFVAEQRAAGEPWLAAHRALVLSDEERAQLVAWFAQLPPGARAMAVRFPIGCVVRSRPGASHQMPPPGMHAQVFGYRDTDRERLLLVDMGPDSPFGSVVSPDEVELVECIAGMTPAVMAALVPGAAPVIH